MAKSVYSPCELAMLAMVLQHEPRPVLSEEDIDRMNEEEEALYWQHYEENLEDEFYDRG